LSKFLYFSLFFVLPSSNLVKVRDTVKQMFVFQIPALSETGTPKAPKLKEVYKLKVDCKKLAFSAGIVFEKVDYILRMHQIEGRFHRFYFSRT